MKHLFASVLIILSLHAQSQKGSNSLKINGGAEITTGHFARAYNTGWGVYVTDYFGIGDLTNLSLSTGVGMWKVTGEDLKSGMSVTRLGLRQFWSNGFYVQADAGIGIGLELWSGDKSFAFGAGPGFLIKSKNGGGVDLSARVNRAFSRTSIGLALGYQFKL